MRQFFTESNDRLSMMRLISYTLVLGGVIIVSACVWFKLDGGHYGVELAGIGVIGKGYQKKQEKEASKNFVP